MLVVVSAKLYFRVRIRMEFTSYVVFIQVGFFLYIYQFLWGNSIVENKKNDESC